MNIMKRIFDIMPLAIGAHSNITPAEMQALADYMLDKSGRS